MVELKIVPENCVRVWEVWVNSDPIEGRGQPQLQARFLNHADALAEAAGKGPMGASDADIRQEIVYNSRMAFMADKDAQLRRSLLKRLSAEEKRVLGIR